jgi:hypothetical protein
MTRTIETLLLLLLVPGFSIAKSSQDNWDNLKELAPGQRIRIVLNDAKSYTGQFQSVTDAGIVVRLASGDQAFERQSVLRVSTQGKSHRGSVYASHCPVRFFHASNRGGLPAASAGR